MSVCSNHPEREAAGQCPKCGKSLCRACYDPNEDGCLMFCGVWTEDRPGAAPRRKRMPVWLQTVVTILAIIGALAVLLLSICAGVIFHL